MGVYLMGVHVMVMSHRRDLECAYFGVQWYLGPITRGRRAIDKHPNI